MCSENLWRCSGRISVKDGAGLGDREWHGEDGRGRLQHHGLGVRDSVSSPGCLCGRKPKRTKGQQGTDEKRRSWLPALRCVSFLACCIVRPCCCAGLRALRSALCALRSASTCAASAVGGKMYDSWLPPPDTFQKNHTSTPLLRRSVVCVG